LIPGSCGYLTAGTIIELELVLREMGQNPVLRDREPYYFSIFGTPSPRAPWGFRFEGHHRSLDFTLAPDALIATAPAFSGADPAEVRSGPRRGLRAMAEADIDRELVLSLDQLQRRDAFIATATPRDIVTGNASRSARLLLGLERLLASTPRSSLTVPGLVIRFRVLCSL